MRGVEEQTGRTWRAAFRATHTTIQHLCPQSLSSRVLLSSLRTYYASAAPFLAEMLGLGRPCCSKVEVVCDGAFMCRASAAEVPPADALLVRLPR